MELLPLLHYEIFYLMIKMSIRLPEITTWTDGIEDGLCVKDGVEVSNIVGRIVGRRENIGCGVGS